MTDFFTDLVGAFDDARAVGAPDVRSAVGSAFEERVRAFADLTESDPRDARIAALEAQVAELQPMADAMIEHRRYNRERMAKSRAKRGE